MADVHDKKTRSYNMSMIRSKDTKPELKVRKFLFSQGFRFRLHVSKMPGKPDIVLKKYNTVIFIHGCFWHAHKNCRYFVPPKTRKEWWKKKLSRNQEVDAINRLKLLKEGWKVITIYECELKKDKLESTLKMLIERIKEN